MSTNKIHLFYLLLFFFNCCSVEEVVGEEEGSETVMLPSPPEGNTTFIDGATWCVATPGATQVDLQRALDWVCGLGMADCHPIQRDGPCFEPDTLLSHASYAFNYYYQQNGNSDIACNFGGTSAITRSNPSYGRCDYSVARDESSWGSRRESSLWWWLAAIVLLLC